MKDYSIHLHYRFLLTIAGLILLATTTGCSERLMRENVFANTETGIGIFITQNPKTQLYEAKLGYFRHELFFVPTSKTIKYKFVDGKRVESEAKHYDPSSTPEVLAEIAIGAKADKNKAGFDVRQRLAVGAIAVQQNSALALMSDDPAVATALVASQNLALKQINVATNPPPDLITARTEYELQIIKQFKDDVELSDGTTTNDPEVFADDLADKLITDETADGIMFHGPVEAAVKIVNELKKIPRKDGV